MAFVSQVSIPHMSYPWRMVTQPDGTLAVNVDEQDSIDEILSCVQEIVVCPLGAWIDQPSFGMPSSVFAQAPVGTGGLTQAITRWEPRATAVAREYPDLVSRSIRNISVDVSSNQPDQ
jgi:phage baseplate assembly protein W